MVLNKMNEMKIWPMKCWPKLFSMGKGSVPDMKPWDAPLDMLLQLEHLFNT